jgi:hypothetical protein
MEAIKRIDRCWLRSTVLQTRALILHADGEAGRQSPIAAAHTDMHARSNWEIGRERMHARVL